jgi:hypothetical protein
MTDQATRVRTELTINDTPFLMAQGQDLDDLKRRIEAASQAGGRFVDFVVVGDRAHSVLVTGSTRVVVTVDIVPLHVLEADDEEPYDADFDFDGFPTGGRDVPPGW